MKAMQSARDSDSFGENLSLWFELYLVAKQLPETAMQAGMSCKCQVIDVYVEDGVLLALTRQKRQHQVEDQTYVEPVLMALDLKTSEDATHLRLFLLTLVICLFLSLDELCSEVAKEAAPLDEDRDL
ncbi:hypothetical protein AK812_SmicGene41207 [Symbiodinium microadriaticum]|uniref:Uncharacterized protein n=1 Tax=Symbiodinium microadriaticum TaxID=2951 RepID=A0A1Q9C6Q4_SYMMI|nr:hypothetical protein AK812_SmicGene41207 [Symbiodinium microadriaticum]